MSVHRIGVSFTGTSPNVARSAPLVDIAFLAIDDVIRWGSLGYTSPSTTSSRASAPF